MWTERWREGLKQVEEDESKIEQHGLERDEKVESGG